MSAPSTKARDGLIVEQDDRTWTFTLDRPDKLNALNAPLVDALLEEIARAHSHEARLLVFRGVGRSFSAGFDLSDLASQSEGDLVLRFIRIEMLLQAIARSPAQTLALAHGKVFGAGADLFAACRQRVASADTSFRMPGLKFGLVLGTRRFGAMVGMSRAREVLEQTRTFSAQEALQMGFVSRLCETEGWPSIVAELQATVDGLDDDTRRALFSVLGPTQDDADLAVLVRSAAKPGLKDRLNKYLGR